MGIRQFLGILVVAACGAEPAADDIGYVSGTRLRAEMLEGDGGERVFRRLFDTELEAECAFGWAEDGPIRCLPTTEVSGYADPTCSVKVTVAACDAPRHAVETVPQENPCGPWPRRVHEVLEEVATETLYFPHTDGCVAGGWIQPGKRAFRVGEPVTLDRFVAAEESFEARGRDFEVGVLRGEDGSRAPWGRRGAGRDDFCVIEELGAPDDLYCFPWYRASANTLDPVFSDPDCTQKVADTVGDCGVPDLGQLHEIDRVTFEDRITLFTPGPRVPETSLFEFPPSCLPARPEVVADGPYFAIGAPLDPSAFPRVMKTRKGDGRLETYHYASEDGAWLGRAGRTFYDSELGLDCFAQRFSAPDGGADLRCIPEPTAHAFPGDRQTYADPDCTERIVEAQEGAIVLLYGPAICPYLAEALTPVGPRYDGKRYTPGPMGGCLEVIDLISQEYYFLDPLPLDPFAFAEIKIEY